MISKFFIKYLIENKDSILSVFYRTCSALSLYIITAIITRKLNANQFAIWTIFITVVNLTPLLNFGVTTGLVNKLTYINSQKSKKSQNNTFISGVFLSQLFLSFFLITLYFIVINSIKIKYLFLLINNVSNFNILATLLIFSVPFQSYSSILYSYKKINTANFLGAIQSLFLLLSIILIENTSKLETYLLSYSITYTISFILLLIFTVFKLRISIHILNFKSSFLALKKVIRPSLLFWVMSLIANLLGTAQILIVTYFFGIKSAPNFFLFQRLFSIINTFHLAYISPYTVKFIFNVAQDNWSENKFIINNLIFRFTIPLYLFLGVLILIFHPIIFKVWTSLEVKDYYACSVFFLSFFILSIGNIYSVFLSSLGHFMYQIYFALISFLLFCFFFLVTKNYLNEYSVVFSTIPSGILLIYFINRYIKNIISRKEILL